MRRSTWYSADDTPGPVAKVNRSPARACGLGEAPRQAKRPGFLFELVSCYLRKTVVARSRSLLLVLTPGPVHSPPPPGQAHARALQSLHKRRPILLACRYLAELAQGLATPSDRVATAGVQLKAGHGRLTADGRRVTSSRMDELAEGQARGGMSSRKDVESEGLGVPMSGLDREV